MTLCCTKTDIDDLEAYMICIFISLSQFLSSHAISLRPVNVLLARDSICLARYMLSPFAHPSVRLSVCLSVRRVYHRKTAEGRIMKFSPHGSPIPIVFWG